MASSPTPARSAPVPAYVPRRAVVRNTGLLSPDHHEGVHEPLPDRGDPFPRHVVHSGDFYTMGKARTDPGVHRNYYTAIPYLQGIADKFWGAVMPRFSHRKTIAAPRGNMRALGADVNMDRPPTVTVGDLATFSGRNRERIRTAMRG